MGETKLSPYLEWLKNDFEKSPFWIHMGIQMDQLEEGNVRIKMPVKEELLNTNGVMHGGAIVSILDSIIGVTIRSTRDVKVATVSLSTQFIAPISEGTLYAEAKITNPGKRIQYVDAVAFNDQGEIIGKALGTFAILKK